jgi:hypothetical protein
VDTQTARRPLSGRQRRRVTAKLLFVLAGTVAFLLSVVLWFLLEDRETAMYVGLWVPSLFSLGALVVSHEGER